MNIHVLNVRFKLVIITINVKVCFCSDLSQWQQKTWQDVILVTCNPSHPLMAWIADWRSDKVILHLNQPSVLLHGKSHFSDKSETSRL